MDHEIPSLQEKGHYMNHKADRILWPFLQEDNARSGAMGANSGPGDGLVSKWTEVIEKKYKKAELVFLAYNPST